MTTLQDEERQERRDQIDRASRMGKIVRVDGREYGITDATLRRCVAVMRACEAAGLEIWDETGTSGRLRIFAGKVAYRAFPSAVGATETSIESVGHAIVRTAWGSITLIEDPGLEPMLLRVQWDL